MSIGNNAMVAHLNVCTYNQMVAQVRGGRVKGDLAVWWHGSERMSTRPQGGTAPTTDWHQSTQSMNHYSNCISGIV